MEEEVTELGVELAKNNKWVALVVAAAVGIGYIAHSYSRQEAPARIMVNGGIVYDGTAVFRNDRIMFPLGFAQRAGVEASYDPQAGIAVLRHGNDNVAVKAESPTLLAFLSEGDRWLREGEAGLGVPFDPLRVPMETAPIQEGEQLFLPLRVIAAVLHADPNEVGWDAATRTATITTAVPLAGPATEPQTFVTPGFLRKAFLNNALNGESATAEPAAKSDGNELK